MAAHLPPIVVFDLDGTLADTAADLVGTLNVILRREGLAPVPLEQARDIIGSGARPLIERGFEASGKDLTPQRLEELYRFFLAHYHDNICIDTTLFPGARDALEALAGAGFRLAVCTNKVEAHSVKVLDALGVGQMFAANCGRDSFPYFKPDPRHLTLTIEKAGGDPRRAVMVGDSRTDIVTAQAAGVPVVAVPFGYTDVPVRDLGPDRLIEHFDELYGAVRDLLKSEAA
ncbi:HAD family hydrolase [Microvirga pudoricolor]|uniref:HAD family hydrolase n=1 Tax=Microvirga pudoricolor TaxID=2778729 RepID=UPI00194EB047|nr:HAD family hydrolase [Microvirga pudoricolor]MBM6594636.1 phosphoglycolate phosphatase [Microvirga pudoricolor]